MTPNGIDWEKRRADFEADPEADKIDKALGRSADRIRFNYLAPPPRANRLLFNLPRRRLVMACALTVAILPYLVQESAEDLKDLTEAPVTESISTPATSATYLAPTTAPTALEPAVNITAEVDQPLHFEVLEPGQHVGVMTVVIAKTGERISRHLYADHRTEEQRRTKPIDVHDSSLEQGFMLDAAWGMPGLREEPLSQTDSELAPAVIATHRNTVVQDVEGRPGTMHNIDQIQQGDTLQINLDNGDQQTWRATGEFLLLDSNEQFGAAAEQAAHQHQAAVMMLYACDSTGGVPQPGSGTYSPDLRRFTFFVLED